MADLSVAHLAAELELHLAQLMVATMDNQMAKSTDTLTEYHLAHSMDNWKVDQIAVHWVLQKARHLVDKTALKMAVQRDLLTVRMLAVQWVQSWIVTLVVLTVVH